LLAQGVRIFSTSASVAQDLEPEYVVVSDDNTRAYITLQENNALLVINLETNSIVSINALGYSDYSSGNGMDASDQTGQILITSLPVKGAYMPDAMAYSTINGQGYLFTANEGDSREFGSVVDAARISTLTLDPTSFPDQAILKNNRFAGRLSGLRYSGDTDNDGDLDEIHVMGGRSFSIWNAETGALVFDSKDMFEQITAAHPEFSAIFNASNSATTPTLKNRSDDKGPEPEGVTTAFINGSHYVFVSMERIGGAMIFNVDNPNEPVFVGYENNRSTTGIGPDLGAEGMIFITAEDSPNGNALLVLANEVSSTLSIYQVNTCAQLSNAVVSADQFDFCSGDNATLSITGDANTSVQWLVDDVEINNETSNELVVTTAGVYAVHVSNSVLSCSGLSNQVEITVNELPTVEVVASANEVCEGTPVVLTASGAQTYSWSNEVTNGLAFVPEATANYTVEGEDDNGCVSTTTVEVVVNANPSLSLGNDITVCSYNLPVQLSAPAGFEAYEWTGGSTESTLTVNAAGTYVCTVTDAFGCEASDEQAVIVEDCLGINSENPLYLTVYPNPFENSVSVVLPSALPSEFIIFNLTGAAFFNQSFDEAEMKIDLSDLPAGVYLLRVTQNSEVQTVRLIKK